MHTYIWYRFKNTKRDRSFYVVLWRNLYVICKLVENTGINNVIPTILKQTRVKRKENKKKTRNKTFKINKFPYFNNIKYQMTRTSILHFVPSISLFLSHAFSLFRVLNLYYSSVHCGFVCIVNKLVVCMFARAFIRYEYFFFSSFYFNSIAIVYFVS